MSAAPASDPPTRTLLALRRLGALSSSQAVLVAIAIVAPYAFVDYVTGASFNSISGYLLAVVVVAWAAGSLLGAAAAVVVTGVGMGVSVLHAEYASHLGLYVATALRLVVFWLVVAIVVLLRDALDQLGRAAHRDPLSDLLNRRGLELASGPAVAAADRRGESVAVVCVDLDGLKRVNDRRGHAAGDELIVAAADSLRVAGRADEIVARTGGDEFVVVLPGCDVTGAEAYVARVRSLSGCPTMTVGIATRLPGGPTLDEVVAAADDELVAAKARHRPGLA